MDTLPTHLVGLLRKAMVELRSLSAGVSGIREEIRIISY
jgi:hypothetical protein